MSSIKHLIGVVFQPVLDLLGYLLALFYAVIPCYPIDVALLTIVIMGALTPLTVKSTRSMVETQAITPEIKKIQAKYKGQTDRSDMNAELTKLYADYGVNPAMGCILGLIQMPFFLVLYSVIRGITNTATVHIQVGVHSVSKIVAAPRYLPKSSAMYHAIVAAKPPGSLNALGINFAARLFSPHGSLWAAIPFLLLVAGAIGVQYLQMARLNARQDTQAEGVQAAVAKFMPLAFAFIYIGVAAILNVYFIVSALVRIITQEVLFARGMADPTTILKPRELHGVYSSDSKPKDGGSKPNNSGSKPKSNSGSSGNSKEGRRGVDAGGDGDEKSGGTAGEAPKHNSRSKSKRPRKPRNS
jgi:YidC/Oxa1 family membrane protein insertase